MLWHRYQWCGGCHNNLTSNTVAELADKMILMSKFSTPGRVRDDEDDTEEVKVELEHDRSTTSKLVQNNEEKLHTVGVIL